MTPAEFRLKRMTLGITVETLAERLGVDRRTIKRWETGYWEIPDSAVAYLDGLWQSKLTMISDVLDYLAAQEEEHGTVPEYVDVTMYASGESHHAGDPGQTWSEHTASLGMLITGLELLAYTPRITYAPEEN